MRRLTAASAVLLIALSACKGSEEAPGPDETPQERLVEAKAQFDDSEFIDFTLETDSLPEGIEGLLRAEGTGSHAPAFTGVVDVETGVTPLEDTSLIAVGGAVYVDLPFIGWTDLDPADYGAPDPADLMKTDGGISSLFTATTGVSEGESERDGEVVLTTLKGTLAGEAVQQVFPSAGSDPFDVTYTVTDDNDVAGAQITGAFYGGSVPVTYFLDLELDADSVDIEAP